jgi:hypothetical protein
MQIKQRFLNENVEKNEMTTASLQSAATLLLDMACCHERSRVNMGEFQAEL